MQAEGRSENFACFKVCNTMNNGHGFTWTARSRDATRLGDPGRPRGARAVDWRQGTCRSPGW
eukprot:6086936-Prymnesium_polylepis.1